MCPSGCGCVPFGHVATVIGKSAFQHSLCLANISLFTVILVTFNNVYYIITVAVHLFVYFPITVFVYFYVFLFLYKRAGGAFSATFIHSFVCSLRVWLLWVR